MNASEESRRLWPKYLACYAFLAVISVLAVLLMQGTIMVITRVGVLLGFSRYAMTVLSQFGFIFLGIFWLIGVFSAEAYLRYGVQKNRLWPRIGKVLALELGLLLLLYVLQSLLL